MTTARFHSLFLCLLALSVLVSCKDTHDEEVEKDQAIAVLIKDSNEEIRPVGDRIKKSSAAYLLSLKGTKAQLWNSFDAHYNLLKQFRPDDATPFLISYKKLSSAKNDTLNLGNAYYHLAQWEMDRRKPDSAYFYYNASKREYELLKDSLQVAEKLINMANISWNYNDYNAIESISTEALHFLNPGLPTPIHSEYAAIAFNNCGLAYTMMADYESALAIYDKASTMMNNPGSLTTIKNNKAWAYMEKGDYGKAIDILKPLAEARVTLGDTLVAGKVYDNYGYSLYKAGAGFPLVWMQKSLVLREAKQDVYGLVPTYVHLAEYYNDDRMLAGSYLQKAYAIATANNSPDDRLYVLDHLRKFHSGELRQKYSDVYISLNDSIDRVRQKAKNQFAKIRYDARQATEENLRLKAEHAQNELEIERTANRSIILFLIVFFLIITGMLFYFLIKKRHRIENIMTADKAQERMAQKVHDELANDMHHTMTFAETQDLSDAEKREALISSLDSMYLRARDISRNSSTIDTGENYPRQLAEMLSEYNNEEVNVLITGLNAISWPDISDYKKQAIWRMLQELMVNMKKHSTANLVGVRFENQGRQIKISYSDNGVGMPDERVVLKNGLQNVENRIRAIGGTITFETAPGKGLKIFMICPA